MEKETLRPTIKCSPMVASVIAVSIASAFSFTAWYSYERGKEVAVAHETAGFAIGILSTNQRELSDDIKALAEARDVDLYRPPLQPRSSQVTVDMSDFLYYFSDWKKLGVDVVIEDDIRLFDIHPGSVLARLGIENGDRLVKVGDRRARDLATPNEWLTALRTTTDMGFELSRDGHPYKIRLLTSSSEK